MLTRAHTCTQSQAHMTLMHTHALRLLCSRTYAHTLMRTHTLSPSCCVTQTRSHTQGFCTKPAPEAPAITTHRSQPSALPIQTGEGAHQSYYTSSPGSSNLQTQAPLSSPHLDCPRKPRASAQTKPASVPTSAQVAGNLASVALEQGHHCQGQQQVGSMGIRAHVGTQDTEQSSDLQGLRCTSLLRRPSSSFQIPGFREEGGTWSSDEPQDQVHGPLLGVSDLEDPGKGCRSHTTLTIC
jgi:hypothetical protein